MPALAPGSRVVPRHTLWSSNTLAALSAGDWKRARSTEPPTTGVVCSPCSAWSTGDPARPPGSSRLRAKAALFVAGVGKLLDVVVQWLAASATGPRAQHGIAVVRRLGPGLESVLAAALPVNQVSAELADDAELPQRADSVIRWRSRCARSKAS